MPLKLADYLMDVDPAKYCLSVDQTKHSKTTIEEPVNWFSLLNMSQVGLCSTSSVVANHMHLQYNYLPEASSSIKESVLTNFNTFC